MAQTLEHNGAVISATPVTVPLFEDDLNIIQKLDDEPNDVGGLTAAELKAEFDAAGNRTKEYINNELIPTILAADLTEETRALAEAERVANEMERVSNEEARQAAEELRVSETEGVVAQAAEQVELARLYAEQAAGAVAGVASFNGRSGAVMPQSGDYSVGDVAGLTEVLDGKASLDESGKVLSEQLPEISSTKAYSTTLFAADWAGGSDGRYYQTVSVPGVSADSAVVWVDVDLSTEDVNAKITYLEAWMIPSAHEVTQGAGTLTFYAWNLPGVNIPVNVGVS